MATELNPFSCESASGKNKSHSRLWGWLNICRDAFYQFSIDLGVFIIHTQNKPNSYWKDISCLSIPGRDDGRTRPGFNIAQECKTRLRGNSLTMWADSTITHFWEESLQKLNMKPQSHMKENLAATIKCFGYRVNDAFMRCGAYQTQIIQRLSPHALGRYLMWNSPFHPTWKDYYYYYYWCLFHNILSFLLGK